jgi:hypothetical protein
MGILKVCDSNIKLCLKFNLTWSFMVSEKEIESNKSERKVGLSKRLMRSFTF